MISKEFVLAGKAIFTVNNDKGQHYTYKVDRKENRNGQGYIYFVSFLRGSDNENDYSYLGLLKDQTGEIVLTRASKVISDNVIYRVARWSTKIVWESKSIPEGYGINHCGCCGRCGRTLTNPKSIESGIGPECIKKMSE